MAPKKPVETLQVGDRVKILGSANWRGRIVESRGPLGPGGMLIYRVRIPGKPSPTYIELRADQLVALPAAPKLGPSQLLTAPRTEPEPPQVKLGKRRKGP